MGIYFVISLKKDSTGIRTQDCRFKVYCDNRFTIESDEMFPFLIIRLENYFYFCFLRCRQGSNLRGQSPIDFKSISLTTRTRHLMSLQWELNSWPCPYKGHALTSWAIEAYNNQYINNKYFILRNNFFLTASHIHYFINDCMIFLN